MKVPIIVNDAGDLSFFRSVESLERYIEPTDVREGNGAVYDSEGRRLSLATRRERRPVLFGLFRVPSERTVLECEECEPGHAEVLRTLLAEFLRDRNMAHTSFADSVPLGHLLELAISTVGFTN